VPLTLAENHSEIEECLSGHATTIALSQELEDALIHFHYGRKAAKGELVPDTHKAASADTYLRAADGAGRTNMKDLYAELCQVVHPAAQSLMWMVGASGQSGTLTAGDDKKWIVNLCRRHSAALEVLHMQSINTSILIFKVLNRFPVQHLWTDYVQSVNMENVPVWSKIQR